LILNDGKWTQNGNKATRVIETEQVLVV
jgi:hypothetical protein